MGYAGRLRRAFVFVVTTLLAFVLALCGVGAASADPYDTICAVQIAAAQDLQRRIDAHNAQPNVFEIPAQQAAANAYDAEAAQLNAEKVTVNANLDACASAAEALALAQQSTAPVQRPSPERVNRIRDGIDQLPPGWKPATGPVGNNGWQIPRSSPARPLYDALRSDNPRKSFGDHTLRDQARPSVGDKDPAYPGRTIRATKSGDPAVSADHIVPLTELINLPGFTRLTPENMWYVVTAPANFQWLSRSVNLAKSSRSMAQVSGIDARFQQAQVQLENEVRTQLRDIIDKLLKAQGG